MAPLSTFAIFGLLASAAFGTPTPPGRQGTGANIAAAATTTTTSKIDRVLGVPIINPSATNLIANAYIVVYNKNFTDDDIEAHQAKVMAKIALRNKERRELHARSTNDSSTAPVDTTCQTFKIRQWRAMAMNAAEDSTMLDIYNADEVNYIEQDARVNALALTTQTNAPTGLVRLSHSSANASTSYVFDDSAGKGITAYVVDTGIRITHSEFGGRATFGANFVNSNNTDENGHGSHVAGTIGGTTFGVAKNVSLVAVKVLDAAGSGTNSGVIAGMNFVATNATARGISGKAVMNMSLGGSKSRAVNAAIDNILAAGVMPIVAAGNENQDAANDSPASATGAIAVGAIDPSTDARASFSNFGRNVAIFAPGVGIKSVGITSDTASATLSGTSMASPHIAGLAAYLMALESITNATVLLNRMTQLANATGSIVSNNVRRTTTLIANNGNL